MFLSSSLLWLSFDQICFSPTTFRLHAPLHCFLQPPIYWKKAEPCPKYRRVTLTRCLFPRVGLMRCRTLMPPTATRAAPTASSRRDLSDWGHPILFPPVQGCLTLSEVCGFADILWPQISPPDAILSTMFSFSLNCDLEERIGDFSKNHLKTTNNSAPAYLTASSGAVHIFMLTSYYRLLRRRPLGRTWVKTKKLVAKTCFLCFFIHLFILLFLFWGICWGTSPPHVSSLLLF
ncbi:hypothetical protein I3843_07G218100 [Carya illinoinensis]|nr:hypothetical protein I3843_07G218100 [Carya illinoinensis]